VQGTRDAFGTPAELTPVLDALQPPPALHVAAQGDHSFKLSRKDPAAQAAMYAELQRVIAAWIRSAP
jgi:predicted alpha/beta-hydrolase family hydrolase